MKYFFPLLFVTIASALSAQAPEKGALNPCGTRSPIDPHTKAFLMANPGARPNLSDTLWVGLQIHLVGKDDGSNRFSASRLLDAFCRLNTDFEATNIRFYFKYDWNLIDSTAWWSHDTITAGRDMMFANDVPDATNCYFVADPAGNCGYNLPYASVAMAFGCSGINDHTWAHELGHQYGVAHPFIGWENTAYDFNSPTPDTVYYDYTHFHSTPDTVNAPLDFRLVEYADGSNCDVAGDLLCDTDPDYLGPAQMRACNPQGVSTMKQKDPAGNAFFPDATLFMNYYPDNCQNRFSDQQIAIMRDNLQNLKPMVLTPVAPATPIAGQTTLLSPMNGETVPNEGGLLRWSSVPGATGYLVQVSRFFSFTDLIVDTWTADTTYTMGKLTANFNHYWRIRPFNIVDGCVPYTTPGNFKPLPSVSAVEPGAGALVLYPTLSAPGTPMWLEGLADDRTARLAVYDALGRLIWQQQPGQSSQRTAINLPATADAPGVYRLVVQTHAFTRSIGFVRQ